MGFDLVFLSQLSVKNTKLLHFLTELIEKERRLGTLTESTVQSVKAQLEEILVPSTSEAAERKELPQETWPDDKLPKERAVDFFRRVWGEYISDDTQEPFLKSELRHINYELYRAMATDFSRNGVPEDLKKWWKTSPRRSPNEVDKLLQKYDIKCPEDAFRRGLPREEAQRLYNGARARQIRDTL